MKVAIIMGSNSDYPIMKECEVILKQFNIEYESKVISAHRTPDLMYQFARASDADIIIAGAGGAAHLPGMVASLSIKPVIGVPIKAKSLDGLDSLLSIVQMPKGVPVATVGINQGANAALLAIQMLSINNPKLAEQLKKYKEEMISLVMEMELI